MKYRELIRGVARAIVAAATFAALKGAAMAEYDFEKAWKDVEAAQRKNLPRTVTNKVEEIEREATKAERWPDAARAFLVREDAMKQFTDGESRPDQWLPAFAASVDAKPGPLQAVLQLHLAHTYQENSNRWRWGGAVPTKLDDEAAKGKMPPWSPEKIAATLESQFEKVFAHSEELKTMKLDDWSALFNRGTWPAQYCPTLFDFAVRDAIQFYGETIPDKTLEKGLALYDSLIEFHRADGNLDARAMTEIQRAEYICTFDEKPTKARDAEFEKFLDGFLVDYEGKTEVVAFAAEKKARMLIEAHRDGAPPCGDAKEVELPAPPQSQECGLVAAHDLAAAYAAKWPDSPGGKMCANIVAGIEAKSLDVEVERNWCAPWPQIEVKAKNLDEVYFRLVRVSFDDLVKDCSMGEEAYNINARSAIKDNYLKRVPAKEWTQRLDLKPGYAEQKFSCPVPQGLPCGHYVLYAAANEKFGADKQPLFAQYVTVTPLALAIKTGNGEFGGTVYRAESGEPVEGAKVELWGYPQKGGRFQTLRETYVTDKNGEFKAEVDRKAGSDALSRHVRVIHDGAEVLSLGNEGSGYIYENDKTVEFIDLFTDRSLYRPGQEIKVKGIAYHADPFTRDFRTQREVTVRLILNDPNGKEVASVKLRPNKWGSFTHTFTAPSDRLTGSYYIRAWYLLKDGRKGEGNKSVNIEEYKRPKFTASFEGAPEKVELGKPVTVTGKALTYSGLPVQHAKVKWNVERQTRYPGWWRWFGADDDYGERFVGAGEAETDENGVFRVTFTPVASPTADLSGDPSFEFTVTAYVTDDTGEERSSAESFEIGTVQWRASVWVDGAWQTPEKGVPVRVQLNSLAGAELPVNGTLKAFRLVAPKRPVRKPAGSRHYAYIGDEKGPWDWKNWDVGEEVASRGITHAAAEKWQGEMPLTVGAYRLVFETKDPNGKTVKDMAHVCVFDPKAEKLALAVPNFFCEEKTSVKVGETLRAYWGTGYDTGFVRIRVTSNRKVILDELRKATSCFYELPIKDEHRGQIRIETTFVRENRIYTDGTTVNVPWDNKYLDIKAEHLTSKLSPGKEETWKFRVSGPSEVLAFMYDRSLDAYKWHDVSTGFSSHFTAWMRYISSPILQNATTYLYCLDGRFPIDRKSADFSWPSWKIVPSRYGNRMKRKVAMLSRGGAFNGAVAACAPMAEVMVEEEASEDMCMSPASQSAILDDGPKEKDPPPRMNLKETAFFFPDMETDADGNVSLTFTVPDALTGWKLLMVAHDNELRSGVLRNEEIVTTKPLMCEPNPPRFAREGDDFLFAVKVTNTDDSPQKGVVELGVEELGREQSNNQTIKQSNNFPFSLAPHESRVFEFKLAIPDGCGYLKYVAKAKCEKFTDGEGGVLPVLSRRILVREAVQLNVRGNATKRFALTNLIASAGSDTIRHQDLTVRAVSRPAWYAVLSLPYLMEFPHECCEQTFSRYYANALGAHIANSDQRIRAMFDEWKAAGAQALKSPLETDEHLKSIALEETPWVREAEHETAARARLGDLFGEDRLKNEQARCIEKLRLSRNGDGRWPWFPGGPSSDYITLYILTGFARLNHLAGLSYPEFFASAVEALDRRVSEDVKERLLMEKRDKIPFRLNGFDIRWMYMHSFKGVDPSKDKEPENQFVAHLRKEWTDLGLESQALAAIAMKRRGEVALAKEIMASIKERGVLAEELGMYWKVPYFFSSSVFAAPVSTQALIVEAFREVTGDEESAEACNVWLLKQKQTQDWATTAATADAIYALMLGGGADLLAGDMLAEVTLGGVKVPTGNAEKGTGMYSHRYASDDIKPEMGEIKFTGAGEKGVAWGGVHWSYFEDVLKVRAHEPKELRIEKRYYKKTKGAEGTRLAAIGEALEPGDELVARLEITSDRSYEFVHLLDGRPACAEPVDVLSSYRWRDGVGYYQSTKDAATHYYIDRLNKGVFVLETSYRVQQKGVFTGGIATIQCMYAPEFTAHSTAETVRVGVGLK
jgi:protocatechuate 3,4-dioxygenase beta subunit